MLNFSNLADRDLELTRAVVTELNEKVPAIGSHRLMIVGARCRDLIHSALGMTGPSAATSDLDLAIALTGWHEFEEIRGSYVPLGSNGIRFRIAGVPVDVVPFGPLENPTGVIAPPPRIDPMSVWAFEEIYASSLPLEVATDLTIRIPTVAGYTAAKAAAWLDRSEYRQLKDARDLALAMHWYAESSAVMERLYAMDDGVEALMAEGMDVTRAAARLLGMDVRQLLGPTRTEELLQRWPGDVEMLTHNFVISHGQRHTAADKRRAIIDAFTGGLTR